MMLNNILKKVVVGFSFMSFSLICTKTDMSLPSKESDHKPLQFTSQRNIDIQKVMDYQMPHVIARYCKDYSVSQETAKKHEIELKRYLILAAEDDDSLGMFSKEVDELWHTFLLFTKEYQQFCDNMFGHFIHHEPLIDE